MKELIINLIKENSLQESVLRITLPIEKYVDKIYLNSTIIPYFIDGNMIGMISYYNNDDTKKKSFLTLILIAKKYQGKGIGKLLLETSCADLRKNGFKSYILEVLKTNTKAIKLYEEYAFQIKEEREETWLMEKTLL
jgi:ribosomal protein S18 acetylase RimI-like enzyme